MKLKKAGRRILALALAAAMLLGACQAVFAIDTGEETIKYVSFGDSMTNGFGLEGYGNNGYGNYGYISYPMLFAEWLEEQGYTVEHSMLSESCTRIEDANFIIRFPLDASEEDTKTIDKLMATKIGTSYMKKTWDTYKDEWRSVFGSAGDAFTWNEFVDGRWRSHVGSVREAAEIYQEAVAEADIISTGLGDSNFGVFFMGRLMAAVGFYDGYYEDGFAYDWAELESALYDLPEEVRVYILEKEAQLRETIVTQYGSMLTSLVPEDKINDLIDVFEYTVVSAMYNYYRFIDRCVELNPDVEIISVGLMNTMQGMYFEIEEGVSIDIGDLLGAVYDIINPFMYFVTTGLQLSGKYSEATFYYVECPESVDTIYETYAQIFEDGWTVAEDSSEMYDGLDAKMIRFGYGYGYGDDKDDSTAGLTYYFNEYMKSFIGLGSLDNGTATRLLNSWIMAYEKFMDLLDEYCPTDAEKIVEFGLLSQGISTEHDYSGCEIVLGDDLNKLNTDILTAVQIYLGFEEAVVNASESNTLKAGTFSALSNPSELLNSYASAFSGLATTTEYDEQVEALTKSMVYGQDENGNYTVVTEGAYNTAFAALRSFVEPLLKPYFGKGENESLSDYEYYTGLYGYLRGSRNVYTTAEFMGDVIELYRTQFLVPAGQGYYRLTGVSGSVAEKLGEEPMNSLLHMLGRLVIANGVGAHPTANVHYEIAESMKEIYGSKTTADYAAVNKAAELLEELAAYLGEHGEEITTSALEYAVENGLEVQAKAAVEALKDDLLEKKDLLKDLNANQIAEVLAVLQAELDDLEDKAADLAEIAALLGEKYELYNNEVILETKEKVESTVEYIGEQIAAIKELIEQLVNLVKDLTDKLDIAIEDVNYLAEAFTNVDVDGVKTDIMNLDEEALKERIKNNKDAVLKLIDDVNAVLDAADELVNQVPENAAKIYDIIITQHQEIANRALEFAENVLDVLDLCKDLAVEAAEEAYDLAMEDAAEIYGDIAGIPEEIKTKLEEDKAKLIAQAEKQLETAKAETKAALVHAKEVLEEQYDKTLQLLEEAELLEKLAAVKNFILDKDLNVRETLALLAQLYINATKGVIYKSQKSTYVAFGDASAVNTYVELVAEEFGMKAVNAAKADNSIANAEYDILANYKAVSEADFITLGYSNVQFLRDALKSALSEDYSPNWSEFIDEEDMQYVEFAQEKLKEAIASKLDGTDAEEYEDELYRILETIIFDTLYYEIAMPKVAEAIKEINPDALIAVITQYNPLKNASIVVGDQSFVIGEYVDLYVTAMEHYGVLAANNSGAFITIAAPDVEMTGAKEEYTIKDFLKLAFTGFAALNPSEEGAEYIKEQIVNSVIVVEPDYILGDVNLDGEITALDATLILQYYAGLITEDSITVEAADVNLDGDITALDATLVLQYYAGLIEEFVAQ